MLQVYGKNKIFKISACYLKDKRAWPFEKGCLFAGSLVRPLLRSGKSAEC
jgi:hypothetical protein